MTFEFLIAYGARPGNDVIAAVRDVLTYVLLENLNDFEEEMIEQMIIPRQRRLGDETPDSAGDGRRHALLAFTLELPDGTNDAPRVVDEFAAALVQGDTTTHVVKFEDTLLLTDLARWAEEIFFLEMKLRRALTFIYLHAYQDGNPYDILCDERVRPANDLASRDAMERVAENQFFHLTFGLYVCLNERPEVKQLQALLDIIQDSASYDAFRAELTRLPVGDEDDAQLLAGLKEKMDAIEKMRNCVAHNRRPSHRIMENYNNARPLLDKLLTEYLTRWEVEDPPVDAAGKQGNANEP